MGWGGLHSHFHVQPNYSVEAVLWLWWVVVGVVAITLTKIYMKVQYYSSWVTRFMDSFAFIQKVSINLPVLVGL